MHIADGILSGPVVAGGYALTTGLLAVSLKKTTLEDIPRISVMGAAFFVSSLIHIRLGVTSIHLTGIGLTGILLGIRALPAFFTGLLFQALLFHHGGILSLGVNCALFSCAGLSSWGLMRLLQRFRNIPLHLRAGLSAMSGIFLCAAGSAAALTLSDRRFVPFALVFSLSHLILGIIEGVITGLVISQVSRVRPEILSSTGPGDLHTCENRGMAKKMEENNELSP